MLYFRFDCCFVFVNLVTLSYCSPMATDLRFDFCFHETIITCGVKLLLGIIDPKTEECHGTIDVISVKPLKKVNSKRKRRAASTKRLNAQKVFICNQCEYASKEKYMMDRHVRRIHDDSFERQKCAVCEFSSIYTYSMKRHMIRAHKNTTIETQVSDSSSCVTTRSQKNKTIQKPSDSSSCVTTRSQNKAIQTTMSDVSSFWAF